MTIRKIIGIALICLGVQLYGQTKVEYKPEYPINKGDTIVIITSSDEAKKIRTAVSLTFELSDTSWDCKKVNFVHLLNRKEEERNLDGVLYKSRIMNELSFDRGRIKNYKKLNFQDIQDYALNNKGCNNLEGYLSKPTLFFIDKTKDKYHGYELLPLVWGVRDD